MDILSKNYLEQTKHMFKLPIDPKLLLRKIQSSFSSFCHIFQQSQSLRNHIEEFRTQLSPLQEYYEK